MSTPSEPPSATSPTHLLLVAGRAGVGKTSVCLEIHHQLFEREVPHGLIEGDNLDQAFPPPWEVGLAERNLRAMWRNYRDLGHTRLIFANTVSVLMAEELTQAIGGEVVVTGVLLTASEASVAERLGRREIGSALDLHLRRSRERADELEARAPADVTRVDTDDRSVTEIATQVIGLTGW